MMLLQSLQRLSGSYGGLEHTLSELTSVVRRQVGICDLKGPKRSKTHPSWLLDHDETCGCFLCAGKFQLLLDGPMAPLDCTSCIWGSLRGVVMYVSRGAGHRVVSAL